MNLVLFFLLTLSVVISFKYFALKRQISRISLQIDQVICGKTEKMLDMSLADQDLELLAAKINSFFACQRTSAAKALQHEEELKNSIADISHDLRTPLTVISGHLQILQKTRLSPDQKERIETALRKTCRLKELIDVFYGLSILESGQTEPDWEDLNFSNLLIDFLADNAPLFKNKQISPQITLPESSVYVKADRSMLERILQNLLSNAVRYTSGEICICLSLTNSRNVVFRISNAVSDPEKIQVSRLFERFYTKDQSRHNESTGLGLSVVKILVNKLHGTVEASVDGNVLSVTAVFKSSF